MPALGRILASSLSLLLVTSGVLPAQGTLPVAPGTRVRVWAPERHEGTVVALNHDALILRRDWPRYPPGDPRFELGPSTDTITVPKVQQLRVHRHHNLVPRMLFGAVLGAASGSVVGRLLGKTSNCTGCEDPVLGEWAGRRFGTRLGLIVGTVVGGATAGRWEAVELSGSSARQ